MSSGKKTGMFHQFLLGRPLKILFPASAGIVILLLSAVTILGFRQYILYRHCEQVVTVSRQLLFEFSAIKEHISEALITKKRFQFKDIHGEITALEATIARINDDILIPAEFKQGFITQIDLVGLVVKVRAVQEGIEPPSTEQLSALTAQLRSLFGRVSQFHQGLSSYTQALLLGLHKTLVGCLALVIFVVSTLLFLINRSISNPILQLGQKVRSINEKNTDLPTNQKTTLDVSVHEIINTVTTLASEHLRLSQICNAIALYETLEKKSTAPAERWQDICSVLQANADYCLIWVGTVIEDEELPQPVSACGCLAASEEGCLDILDHLLKYCKIAGGLCDSVSKATQTKTATLSRLFTASLPESLRNLLPFPDDTFSSASFPVPAQHDISAIITLYNPGHHCFSSREMTLLSYFFNHLIHDKRNDSPPHVHSIPENTLSIETLSRIYRSSTLGTLTTGLAHELTDLSNGAINYTQALLDLAEEEAQASESTILLEKLLIEEKKISHLTVELQQLARDTREENRQYTVQEIIDPIVTLTKGQIKTEGIEMQIKIAPGLPVIPKHGKNIQLVILSLIQSARSRIVAQYPVGSHERKQIQIAATLAQQTAQDQILITMQDNGTAWQATASGQKNAGSTPEPWPELQQCRLFLQNFGGDLTITSGSEQQNICTVTVPC